MEALSGSGYATGRAVIEPASDQARRKGNAAQSGERRGVEMTYGSPILNNCRAQRIKRRKTIEIQNVQ